MPADSTLKNCQTLADVLTAGAIKADFTNYVDKVYSASDFTVTINSPTADKTTVDQPTDPVWAAAGGAANNTVGKLVYFYRPISTATNAQILSLIFLDQSGTTNGTAYTAQIAATGISTAV